MQDLSHEVLLVHSSYMHGLPPTAKLQPRASGSAAKNEDETSMRVRARGRVRVRVRAVMRVRMMDDAST